MADEKRDGSQVKMRNLRELAEKKVKENGPGTGKNKMVFMGDNG